MLRRRAAARRAGPALAFDPEILLFDEPLSALDFQLRKALEKELKDLHRETGKTFVYITHSLEEAMVMSDRIAIMNDGAIVQIGSPGEIYNRPRNKFVAQFMGEVNTLEVERAGPRAVRTLADGSEYQVARELDGFETGFLIIRPEVVKIGESAKALANRLTGTLFNNYALGSRTQYQVRIEKTDSQWLVERLQDEVFEGTLGDEVVIGWRPEDSILVED